MTINDLIQAVRPTGRIGVVGVFLPEDPDAEDQDAKEGKFAFDFGTFSSRDSRWERVRPTSSSTTANSVT